MEERAPTAGGCPKVSPAELQQRAASLMREVSVAAQSLHPMASLWLSTSYSIPWNERPSTQAFIVKLCHAEPPSEDELPSWKRQRTPERTSPSRSSIGSPSHSELSQIHSESDVSLQSEFLDPSDESELLDPSDDSDLAHLPDLPDLSANALYELLGQCNVRLTV